jgi:hypothetical protein
MAIYSRFGGEVEVVGYCGKYKPGQSAKECKMVRVKFADGSGTLDVFEFTLKADGGYPEIDQAVNEAPEIVLTAAEIETALDC